MPFNKKVYLDIEIGDHYAGRLVIELYNDETPLAAENFRAFCTGEKGIGASGKPMHYKGSKFHQIIPGFICVGGDITEGDGTGGRESIYRGYFNDHVINGRRHIRGGRGFLSFRKFARGMVGSQFIICLGDGHLLDDDDYVLFGEIMEGEELLDPIESTAYKLPRDAPFKNEYEGQTVVISDCGALPDYPRVFMDITIDNVSAGRIVIELYTDSNPFAAENFRVLCTGEKRKEGHRLHYQGSVLHRVIPEFGLIGGDIIMGNGSGGTSSFEERFFNKDPFVRKHMGPGTVSMLNCGKDDSPEFGSQFLISTRDGPMEWLDGKLMVIGHVVDGWPVVKTVERFGNPSSRTSRSIRIARSGQIGPDGDPVVDCVRLPQPASTGELVHISNLGIFDLL